MRMRDPAMPVCIFQRCDYAWLTTLPVVAALIFGDVRHTSGQSFNVESGANSQGIFPRPGDQLANLNKYGDVLRNYCVSTDPICAGGDVVDTHLNYFDVFTDEVASWVQERIGEADPSSTSSSSGTPTSGSDRTTTASSTEASQTTSSEDSSETTSTTSTATATTTASNDEETPRTTTGGDETETGTDSPSATETGDNMAAGLSVGGSAAVLVSLVLGLVSFW